ncbi:hypothetical protein [Neoroseomonas rubea]|uniref:hypothetical protein n=1 Tax=Neoroseomonas rubea TaxID=2748666 RepID=UPI0018DF4E41|nr:hypothetical protein [Roseomonas rubea]
MTRYEHDRNDRPFLPAMAIIAGLAAPAAYADEATLGTRATVAAAAAIPAAPATEASPADQSAALARQGDLRLRLLDAQLMLVTGRFTAAREAYASLRADMPTSAEPVAGLATVARETGRARLARELQREAVLLDPGNSSLADGLAALERDRAPRLRGDIEQRIQRGGIGSDKADITIGEAGGHWNIGEAWRVGATQGLAHVDATNVRRPSGAVRDFSGDRIRTEIFVQHEWREGATVQASLFANEWSAGFGLSGRLPDDWGYTGARIEYRRPVWDFVEAIIDGAVRDRVAAERFQRFTPQLTGRIEVGLNRYGIPRDEDDILSSATVRGELRYGDLGGIAGLSIAYALDAEYVLDETRRIDASGASFQPLPIVDREVHAGLLGYGGTRGTVTGDGRLTYQFQVGYGADRYGRSGPVAYGTIGYAVGPLEISLRAGYVRNIGRSQGETTVIGAAMAFLF